MYRYVLFNKTCLFINVPAGLVLLVCWILLIVFILVPLSTEDNIVASCCQMIRYTPECLTNPCAMNITVAYGNFRPLARNDTFPLLCSIRCLNIIILQNRAECRPKGFFCWVDPIEKKLFIDSPSGGISPIWFLVTLCIAVLSVCYSVLLCVHGAFYHNAPRRHKQIAAPQSEEDDDVIYFNMYSPDSDHLYELFKTQ